MTDEELRQIEARAGQETHGWSINITCPKCGHVGDAETSFSCCDDVPILIAEVRRLNGELENYYKAKYVLREVEEKLLLAFGRNYK